MAIAMNTIFLTVEGDKIMQTVSKWDEKKKCARCGYEATRRTFAVDGCWGCEDKALQEEAKSLFCPKCGKQRCRYTDGDVDYNQYACQHCTTVFKIIIYEPEEPEPPGYCKNCDAPIGIAGGYCSSCQLTWGC